ncbi:MAG TPA: bifunctional riboflavin kinase/FAD synthetase [Gemmatimonadaceae bacterium]|nr:bifunctional riboflavin kinase/FAD synthetase [Gemmatimonadaceae bacterium]
MPPERAASLASGLPPDVRRTAVTVGTFDGVHLGHRDVLRRLVERARELDVRSVLLTFDPHPLEIVNPPAAPPLLTLGEEKLEVLAESGVDYVVIMPFTHALASFEAERFVDEILLQRLRMHDLLMGHDHGFGRNRSGNVETLRRLGASRHFNVSVIPPVTTASGQPISSTAIRRAVAGGDLARAAAGLGRSYAVSGRVARGERRGRLLGFPTINVPLPSPRKLLPPEGVYAVRVQTPGGTFGGMLNLGSRPTFGDDRVALEAHLFEAEGDLYGCRVRIDFVRRLRDTQRFADAQALVAQLERDALTAREALLATA